MDHSIARQLILSYTEGWQEANRTKILSCLDPECIIIESYGPTYRGIDMIGRWIDSWFAPGNEVNIWNVTALYTAEDVCFFEWLFVCTYSGNRADFEGASLAHFKDERIVLLREYAMTSQRYEWQG